MINACVLVAAALALPAADPTPLTPTPAPAPVRVHVVVDVAAVPAPVAPVALAASTATATATASARTEAEVVFRSRCTLCHGDTGNGDGPGGGAMKPRRFSDSWWQASVSDDDIALAILGGGSARKLSPLMPPNPDLKPRLDVVEALIARIRAFRAPHGTARVVLMNGTQKRVESGDADDQGAAHVSVGGVTAGTWTVSVEDVPGHALCPASAVVVAAVDVRVACPGLESRQPRKSP